MTNKGSAFKLILLMLVLLFTVTACDSGGFSYSDFFHDTFDDDTDTETEDNSGGGGDGGSGDGGGNGGTGGDAANGDAVILDTDTDTSTSQTSSDEDTDSADTTDSDSDDATTDDNTASGAAADSVSYYDDLIVFEFADSYTVGQFANGDYWVHNNGDAVVITAITPESQDNGSGRTINGTMVNPSESGSQGYDSSPRDMDYDDSLNVDPGNTSTNLVASPGTSIVKSISMESDAGRPIISDAAVLTVLSEAPAQGAFRPPYTGSDKRIIATVDDLNYDVLGQHARLGNEPDITEVADRYERVWLEHNTEWTARDIHPENNMPTYGRDIAAGSAEGLILLQLDYTNDEKQTLLIRLVQYGIDIYGVALDGGQWYNNGGHNLGRKMPLLMAATVLDNQDMLAYADANQHFIFQDDQQHFYVSQTEVDMTGSDAWDPDERAEAVAYTADDIGTAEWGIRHYDRPEGDNASWDATYRDVCGPSQTLQMTAAKLMEVEDIWNWAAVFDYADRYYSVEKDNGKFSDYVIELWNTYLLN